MKLGEVCEIVMGQSPKGDTYNSEGNGVPLLNGPTEFGFTHPNVTIWTTDPKKICKAGDLIFCVRGSTTGRMNWADKEYCLGRGVGAFRAASGHVLDTRFIYDQIVDNLERLLSLASGSVFPNLSAKDFQNFEIDWPEKQDRHDIALFAKLLDDKIENNRAMNETLEEMARAIFKSWFVDFDPVHAKSRGEQPAHMDAETAALFPDRFGDDGLPEGWREGELGDFIEVQNGYAFKSADWKSSGVPVVKIGSVKPGFVDLSGSSCVAPELAKEKADFQLNPGDVLVGLTGYVGEVGRVPPCETNPLLNQRVGRIKPKVNDFDSFVYTNIRRSDFKKYAESQAHGSAQPNVSTKQLKSFPVYIPDTSVTQAFRDSTVSFFDKSFSNIAENQTLAELRDTLLPKLMSGEIRIKDAEREVGEAV